MASCDGVGSWMYGFAPLKADGDEGDVHWASVSVPWANLNFAFYAWLQYKLARVLLGLMREGGRLENGLM